MKHSAQLLKGSMRLMILRSLEREAMYGYQMIQQLRNRSEGYFQLGEGALYPLLHELEGAGFIAGSWVEVEERPQRRRYYHLTDKGKVELARRKLEWRGFAEAMELVLEASHA